MGTFNERHLRETLCFPQMYSLKNTTLGRGRISNFAQNVNGFS
jgi:hypothetical protein